MFCQLDRRKEDPVYLAVLLAWVKIIVIVQVDFLLGKGNKHAGDVLVSKGIADSQPACGQVARITDADLALDISRIPKSAHRHMRLNGGAAQQGGVKVCLGAITADLGSEGSPNKCHQQDERNPNHYTGKEPGAVLSWNLSNNGAITVS